MRDGIGRSSDICEEAGIVIGGDQSIADEEPKFGLIVNGKIQLEKINSNGFEKEWIP